MVIRRSDQRRRRVVIDEVSQQRDRPTKPARKKTDALRAEAGENATRCYAFGANRRNQSKTTDFIPKRFLSFSLVVLLLVSTIGILNLLAVVSDSWRAVIGASGMRAFSISGVGSLSSWFSAFLLIVSGLASLQIYALRQHRCDDYRGTYRLWLWMALLLMVGSVHCVVDLGAVLGAVLSSITQQPAGHKIWILVLFKLVALSLLIVRGLFEVKESRGALSMVAIVWCAYCSAILLQLPAIKEAIVVDYEMCYGNVILFASGMLFLSLCVYARFVYLHAHGMIKLAVKTTEEDVAVASSAEKVTAPKRKVESESVKTKPKTIRKKTRSKKQVSKDENSEDTAKLKTKKRPPVPKPSKKLTPPVPKPSVSKRAVEETTEEDSAPITISAEEYAKMSKSQRRRQRKLEKRARRAA